MLCLAEVLSSFLASTLYCTQRHRGGEISFCLSSLIQPFFRPRCCWLTWVCLRIHFTASNIHWFLQTSTGLLPKKKRFKNFIWVFCCSCEESEENHCLYPCCFTTSAYLRGYHRAGSSPGAWNHCWCLWLALILLLSIPTEPLWIVLASAPGSYQHLCLCFGFLTSGHLSAPNPFGIFYIVFPAKIILRRVAVLHVLKGRGNLSLRLAQLLLINSLKWC